MIAAATPEPEVIVSQHAAQRWVERIDPRLTLDEARAAIRAHMPALCCARAAGASIVKLGSGVRLRLRDDTVVTVLPKRRGPMPRAWSDDE